MQTYTLDGTKRYSAGEKVATLTTAADGTATSEPLFLGKFELREEKAPYGMVLLKEPMQTELTYAGEQVKIGYRYRFYFKETQHISLGSEYLNSAISSDHFLGYEELGEFAAEATE